MVRRFGRRRKPRVVWLPTFRQDGPDESFAANAPGVSGTLTLTTAEVVYDAFPVTFDRSISSAQVQEGEPLYEPTTSLQDLVSANEYRLRRIVGKAFLSAVSDELDDPPANSCLVHCSVGFIVCKTYDDGAPTTDFNSVNPLSSESMNDPWIWRRVWILNPYGNARAIDTANSALFFQNAHMFPPTTAGYGSVADGPHIDQKTARVIHREERLFCIVAARQWVNDPDSIALAEVQLRYMVDYRLLASLRPGSSGNRRNASR